jgi:ribose 1,5-bisphosphokinase
VSWIVDPLKFRRPLPDQIGPGRLVVVVGPSGAGKDTLIAGARAACAGDPSVVFPRRVITRAATAAEDHDSVSEQGFQAAAAGGEFALCWEAHGLRYGIPSAIDADIRDGRTVVCNLSRTMIGLVRRRYAAVAVVEVTAPLEVLAARLALRRRDSDGRLSDRVARSAALVQAIDADIVIDNVGRPEVGIRRLLNAIRDPGLFVIY